MSSTDEVKSNDVKKGVSFAAIDSRRTNTAVIVIDFQNEFVRDKGKLHGDVKEMMDRTRMLEKVPHVIRAAREVGALIIHSPVLMKSGEKFKDEDWDPHAYGSMDDLFVEGTWNSEFADEVKPSESDIILRNRVNFSAFRGTILKDVIETYGITCLFVMGFLTNICVVETTVEARELFPDLKIYVCSDGCAAKSKQEHNVAMENALPMYADIITCSEAQTKLSSRATFSNVKPNGVKKGVSFVGTDGTESRRSDFRRRRSTMDTIREVLTAESLSQSLTSTVLYGAKSKSTQSLGRSVRADFNSSHDKWKLTFMIHDRDNSGTIDVSELQGALSEVLCEEVSLEDSLMVINHFGKHKQGHIDISEFVLMLEFIHASDRSSRSSLTANTQSILQNAAIASVRKTELTLKEAASLIYPFRELLHIQDYEEDIEPHEDLSLSAYADTDFPAAFAPSEMRCLALVSHNGMKATMKKFVVANKNILKKFRLTGTNSTMTMLREVFRDEADEIVFGPSCKSGPLGGDAELVALMCSGGLGGMLFFQDPMDSHPHQADIDCLVRQALVHNTVMANTPTSALMMMSVFRAALKDEGKPELIPSFFFTLESPSVAAYKAGQSKVIASHSTLPPS